MKTAKTHKCPYRGCKNKAIPTREERRKHESFFKSRLTRDGWRLGLGEKGYGQYCPVCSERHLI